MSRAGTSFLLTIIVAAVIMGDHFLPVPWRFAAWGLGLSLPWLVVGRLLSRRSQ